MVATVVGQVVAARVLTHEKTVSSALHHCLVVIKQRVKRLQRDGRETGAPGRTRTRNPLIRSQVLYPLSYRCNTDILHSSKYNVKLFPVLLSLFERA